MQPQPNRTRTFTNKTNSRRGPLDFTTPNRNTPLRDDNYCNQTQTKLARSPRSPREEASQTRYCEESSQVQVIVTLSDDDGSQKKFRQSTNQANRSRRD